MTIKIEVECDGLNCCSSREINWTTDSNIEGIGWGVLNNANNK